MGMIDSEDTCFVDNPVTKISEKKIHYSKPLKVIASYLDFSSLVSLSTSTSSLAHLQPKQQIVKGENLLVAGFNPTYSQKRISQKGISRRIWKRSHHPEHYFNVEVETRGLLGVKMVWEWEGKVSNLRC